ncbi:MAG: M1 family metallopeptidase [Woeseiaceae bacterium]|nr:M1 family metallopeptidase [Woeseiaceae bacterium]
MTYSRMRRFRSAITTLLVLLVPAAPALADEADPFRLLPSIRPVAQQLTLTIDPGKPVYSGTAVIDIEVAEPTGEIRLHAEELDIGSIELEQGGAALDIAREERAHGLLVLIPGRALAPGSYSIRIAFANDFNTDGVGIHRNELDGEYYIFSQFEAIDARRAFPTFDEPGFKLPWQLTIRVPEDYVAVTNTPPGQITAADGWVTTAYLPTPPLPSYLVAVAVGKFDTVPIDGLAVPARIVVPRGMGSRAAYAVETTPPLLAWLEGYFGEPYPFRKLDLIATVGAFSGAMEHPGAITYSDFLLLLDESAGARRRDTLLRVTAHELAHQWFGNLVTMQWWDDLWLNESFADWMADKAVEAVYPESTHGTAELRTVFRIMDVDASPATEAIRRNFSATDNFEDGVFLSYYKGKAVLGMFENATGEEVFRDGVIRYLAKYRYGNASAADLWAAIDAGADFDLAGGLASFINQPGIPLVSVTPAGKGRFRIAQSRFVGIPGVEVEPATWIIPVTYRYRDDKGVHTGKLILDKPSAVVELGDVRWILPNADQQGYYRWAVPPPMQQALGEDAADDLSVPERMGMLSNLWALLGADRIDGDDYLAALTRLAADPDPDVLAAVLDQLDNVEVTFVTADLEADYAGFLRRTLTPAFETLGGTTVPPAGEQTDSLRPRLMYRLAVEGGSEPARALARSLADAYLGGDLPLTEYVNRALRVVAWYGGEALFETLRERFEASESPGERLNLLAALGSFAEPALARRALDYSLSASLRRNDMTTLILAVGGERRHRELVRDWLMANDRALRERLPDNSMSRIPVFIVGCTVADLDRIRAFYTAGERAVPGIENALEDAEAEARRCSGLRARELGAVQAYL